MSGATHEQIHILHVDDEPDFTDLAATFLERYDDQFSIETATSGDEGLNVIADCPPDCIVSDYNMPGMDGLEFLEAVREEFPEIPFILFTGKGSEAVASRAISAGVTDYIQKQPGSHQFELLANRIERAVDQYRTEQELERQNRRLTALFENFPEPTVAYRYEEDEPRVSWVNEAFTETFGYDAEEATDEHIDDMVVPPERRDEAQRIDERVRAGEQVNEVLRRQTPDGLGDFSFRNISMPDDEEIDGFGVYADITELKQNQRELERQNDLFAKAQEIATIGAYEYDVDEERLRWTDQVYEMHGLSTEFDLSIENVAELYHPDDRPKLRAAIDQAITAGEPYDLEVRITPRGGRERWIRTVADPQVEDGEVVRVRGAVHDITDRKEREQTLKRYQRIVEASGDALYALDTDGYITLVNQSHVEWSGYARDELIGSHVGQFMPEREVQKGSDLIAEILSEPDRSRGRFEMRVDRPDGETRIYEDNLAVITDETGEFAGSVGAIRDITERKEREEELEQARQQFRTLFDQLTQPLVEVEYEGLDPIVRDVNPAFEETFGYDAETIVGESLDAYIVPDDHKDEATHINQHVREGGRLVSREVTRQTADGLREFLLENAVYKDGSGGFAIYTDVSDRNRWEEALGTLHDVTREFMNAQDKQTVADRAVETARTVLDQPINGLWFHDPEADELQPAAMTEDAAELLGDQPTYTRGESLSWQAFQDGELRVYDNVRTEPERLEEETPIRSEIIVPIGTHGVMNMGATEPATFSEIDISLARILGKTIEAAMDRADREQQLRRQRAALERQNKRLDEFAGVVSHDLRNPLQLATTRVELAQEDCESPHLADAADALERMETLLSDLLTVAREGSQVQETEAIGLSAVVADSWTYVETADATLRTELTHTIRADRGRLRQLLENLLRNAVGHGGDDVTVTIGDLADGFYVADNGPGIPADERDEVFTSGYSTTEDGTGFGLNIVREIVEAHGWEISITDSSDGGARFEITGLEVVDSGC